MKIDIRKISPIYINTLNIFRPLKTWWKCKASTVFPTIKISFKIKKFNYLYEHFYTWYWWEHAYLWNFWKKPIIILIDDVFWKSTYGIVEYQQSPFILIRIFNFNLIIKFVSSPHIQNDIYWERMIRKSIMS